MTSAENLYLVIGFVCLIVTIFSLINFAYFIQIYNDDDPQISDKSSVGLIVINGLVSLAGLGITIYCLYCYFKRPAVEAKIFQHYKRDVEANAAVKQTMPSSEPAVLCNDLDNAVKVDENGQIKIDTKGQEVLNNTVNGFQNLGLNIYEFAKECEAQGLTKKEVSTYLDAKNIQNITGSDKDKLNALVAALSANPPRAAVNTGNPGATVIMSPGSGYNRASNP